MQFMGIAGDGEVVPPSPELFLHEQHRRWIEGERELRDVRIVVIFQQRKFHAVAVVRHLNDDRDCRGELR